MQQSIIDGILDSSKGYELARVEDEKSQRELFDKTVAKGMSVRRLKREVRSRNVQRKREEEETLHPVKIPAGVIPGVFFKDSSDMSELADESVSLVVTSPPYGVDMEYEEGVSFEGLLDTVRGVFSECNRVLIPGGKICVNFGDIHNFGSRNGGKPEIKLMGHHYQEILGRHGLRLIDTIIWKKCKPGKGNFNWASNPQANYREGMRHGSYRIINNTEHIHIFEKNGNRNVDPDIEDASRISKEQYYEWNDGVWEIPPVRNQKDHPAQFPEEIPRRLIKLYSYKGDIVLDCFGGSMTTVKVANELGRTGVGYEIDEKYKPAIMRKLGLTEGDLKKSEPVLEQKENRFGFIDQFQSVIAEIISTDGKSAGDIMSVRVPVKDQISKEDITIEYNIDGETPDPSGSPSPPQICKPDGYNGNQVGESPHALIPERCSGIAPHLNKVILGDCLDKLKNIPDSSADLIVTDPPYGMTYMKKDWDKEIPSIEIWREALRVLKPGAFAFIMSIPRQDLQSRMIVNLEEAGFRINFSPIYWAYANGFPKAHNIKKALNRKFGAETNENKRLEGAYRAFQPKPAVELILVAMKPLDEKTYLEQALKKGKGITWPDDCRIPYAESNDKNQVRKSLCVNGKHETEPTCGGKKVLDGNLRDKGRFPANLLISDNVLDDGRRRASGLGFSDIFSLDNWAEKNLKNLPFLIVPKASTKEKNAGLENFQEETVSDRSKNPVNNPFQRGKTLRKNTHPTVKPIKLMCYLITMGSREGDLVLDLFAGAGTTCVAAKYLKRDFIGIEIEEKYQKISEAKVEYAALSMAA
jgi:DNA modification methylase